MKIKMDNSMTLEEFYKTLHNLKYKPLLTELGVYSDFGFKGFLKVLDYAVELRRKNIELERQNKELLSRQVGRKRTITKGMENRVMKYYDAGMSYRDIGKRIGISHTSVKNIVSKLREV